MNKFRAILILLIFSSNGVLAETTLKNKDSGLFSDVDTSSSSDFLKIGGAVRFNYEYKSYESNSSALNFELFRIKVTGKISDIDFYAQYRWYEDFNFPEYAYLSYDINDESKIQFGLNMVPFGLQPYSSHGYWESLVYHIGLEDDNDMGLKYIHKANDWELIAAFYKNAELSNDQPNRFSFDLVTREDDPNTQKTNEREANSEQDQWNFRVEKTLNNLKLGASAQHGEIFNEDTNASGEQNIFALHASYDIGKWNYQLEVGTYDFNVKNPSNISSNQVLFGAFGTTFNVASEADFLLFNIKKDIDVSSIKYLDELSCYDNWGMISPKKSDSLVGADTIQNLLGCSVKKGPLLVFAELISGNNSVFVNGPGIGLNGSTKIDHRLNINIGLYF